MKKILLLLLFCFTLLFSEEPKMVINKFDGESRIISINELESLSFTKSEKNSTFNIFLKNVNDDIFYFTELINIIRIDDDYLHISYTGSEINYELQLIDSITITPIPFEAVIIDNQMWMKRNLNVTHYRNGGGIFESETYEEWEEAGISKSGVCSVYENNPENAELYGRLYNWFAVNDERGLPPKGWRVSSEEDWNVLKEVVGSNPGSKLAGGYDLWADGALRNDSLFNESGFMAIPSGYRSNINARFEHFRQTAYFWTSSLETDLPAIYRYVSNDYTGIFRNIYGYNGYGFSVRCIKD